MMFNYGVGGVFKDIVDHRNGQLVCSPFRVAYQAKASVEWCEEGNSLATTSMRLIITSEGY
jgi:hypothetical protein